jgi:hypothetical protein
MAYTDVDGKVINDKGETAISYWAEIQKFIRMPDKTEYIFVPNRHVSMSWIKPQHIDYLLQQVKSCCGGNNSAPAFRYTSISNVRIWSGDAER